MQIVHLEAFMAVVEERSFTRAADRLHLTQPAITRQIAALEAELHTQLLDRLGRNIQVTAAGAVLLEYANRILQMEKDARQAVADVRSGDAGRLIIGASSTLAAYFLPDILRSFRTGRPNLGISVFTGASAQVMEMVRDGRVDVGFVTSVETDEVIISIPLGSYETCVVLPLDHPLSAKSSIAPCDLAGIPLLMMEPGTNLRSYVDTLLNRAGVEEFIAMELDNVEAIKRMVEAGLGISLLPAVAVKNEMEQGRLTARPLADIPRQTRSIQMIYRKDKYVHKLMREFITLLDRN